MIEELFGPRDLDSSRVVFDSRDLEYMTDLVNIHSYYASLHCRLCNGQLKLEYPTGTRRGPFSKRPVTNSRRNLLDGKPKETFIALYGQLEFDLFIFLYQSVINFFLKIKSIKIFY